MGWHFTSPSSPLGIPRSLFYRLITKQIRKRKRTKPLGENRTHDLRSNSFRGVHSTTEQLLQPLPVFQFFSSAKVIFGNRDFFRKVIAGDSFFNRKKDIAFSQRYPKWRKSGLKKDLKSNYIESIQPISSFLSNKVQRSKFNHTNDVWTDLVKKISLQKHFIVFEANHHEANDNVIMSFKT